MASLITTRGLQNDADRSAGLNGPPPVISQMSVDNGTGAFAATHDQLSDPASPPTQMFGKGFDATYPQRSGQSVLYKTTLATTEGNFVIRRIALHNGTATLGSVTLEAGVDAQSITKNSQFSLAITLRLTRTST